MFKKLYFIISLTFFVNLVFSAEVDLGFSSFVGLSLTNADFVYNKHNLKLKSRGDLSEGISMYGSIDVNYYGTPNDVRIKSYELENSAIFYPVEFSLDEAYISFKNFLFSGLDFTAGKQRISWGKADKINPTDILNPVDLTMITELSSKIPTLGFNFKYYFPGIEDTGIQLVLEPYSGESVIPSIFIEKKLTDKIRRKITNANEVHIDDNWNGDVIPPDKNITNGLIGAKIFGKLLGFDFSLSTVRRINDIPYVKEIYLSNITTISFPSMNVTKIDVYDKSYIMDYHKETVIGFDLAKDFEIFLSWIELSVTFPDETKTTTYTVSIITNPISTNYITTKEEIILKDPYLKFVIGLDKSFDSGFYINFQYAHGLFIERGYEDERLQDYFTLNLEQSLFNDKLKLRAYGIANVDKFTERFKDSDIIKSFYDNSAFMGAFEVIYSPIMGLNLKVGIMGIDGNGDATLAMYKDYDMAYFEVSMGF